MNNNFNIKHTAIDSEASGLAAQARRAVSIQNKEGKKKGFTLIELIVVTALIGIISAILAMFLSQSLKTYRIKSEGNRTEENAAAAMREFEYSARAASKILTANSNEFKFLRFYDLTSPSPTQVRYFIDGNDFKVGVTEPVGMEPDVTYPEGNEKIDLIIQNVTNTSVLFTYYDSANEELDFPVNIAAIRMAELKIRLDKDPSSPPEAIEQVTRVSFRNLKDNL